MTAPPPNGTAEVAVPLPAASVLQRARRPGGRAARLALLGPAFVACIAYVDPGNVAAYLAAGAAFVGMGGALVDERSIASGDRGSIEAAANQVLAIR